MEITITISKATVIQNKHTTDTVILHSDLPTAYPELKYPTSLRLEARQGYGVTWCRKVLKIEPEVVPDVRT